MVTDLVVATAAAVFAALCAGFAAGVLASFARHRRARLEPLDPMFNEPRLVTRYPRPGVEVVAPTFHDGEHEGWWSDPPTAEINTEPV